MKKFVFPSIHISAFETENIVTEASSVTPDNALETWAEQHAGSQTKVVQFTDTISWTF